MITIYYFSATGNSLTTARRIAEGLDECRLIPVVSAVKQPKIIEESEAVGFVFPVYFSDMPCIVRDLISKMVFTDEKPYLFAVPTCRGHAGACHQRLDQLLMTRGQKLSLARNITMPGNLLKASAKNEKAILKGTEQELKDILWDVFHRTADFKSENKGPGKRFVQQTPFRSPNALIKRFRITEDCDGCGICAQLCPTGNITVTDGKAVHGKNCANCYACRHWCPKAATVPVARMFGKRPQYHHPSIRVKDFLKK